MPYSMSDTYFNAQQAGDAPVTLAVLGTVLGYHCFSAGPYAAINLPETTPYQVGGGRLIALSPLTSTLIPDASDLFANYTQTEAPDCTITLYAGDDEFADQLSVISFVTATLTIVRGFLTTPYADMLILFSGTVTREQLDDTGLHITGVRA
jgi:hypothetical protein